MSDTLAPRVEELQRQSSPTGVYRMVTHIQKIMTPTSAMAQSLVEGRGKVIAVTPEKQQIVLEHGEIKGFMDAMTMGYKVSSTALFKGLKPGDEVRFSIDPKKSTIVKIVKVEK
ncbi:MAG TPA: copper-binding protein [Candidatus Binatia bacterium]|nr:copper-binding protein [Candidatus Binatia bacterium]